MPELRGARVLVTGGAGFIGSHLVDGLLAAGAERVVVVDNFFLGREENLSGARERSADALVVYREDAADAGAMDAVFRTERPEVVFNLATKALLYSFFNPAGACRVNLDIAICLAELLRAGTYSRLVHLSSSEVYGSARTVPMDEDHPLLAETSYAAGKAAADLLVASYVNMFGLDVVTMRPFNNYGPRQNDGALAAVVPLTIKRLQKGVAPVVEGDGLQTRDFMYVGDTVDVVMRAATLEATRGHTLNVGTGRETSIQEIVDALCRLYGFTGEIHRSPTRPADVRRHCASVHRLESVMGPVDLIPLEEGLARTVDWYDRAARVTT